MLHSNWNQSVLGVSTRTDIFLQQKGLLLLLSQQKKMYIMIDDEIIIALQVFFYLTINFGSFLLLHVIHSLSLTKKPRVGALTLCFSLSLFFLLSFKKNTHTHTSLIQKRRKEWGLAVPMVQFSMIRGNLDVQRVPLAFTARNLLFTPRNVPLHYYYYYEYIKLWRLQAKLWIKFLRIDGVRSQFNSM